MGDDIASKMFLKIDINKNGVISIDELKQHCSKTSNVDEAIKTFLKNFDKDKDKNVTYEEFAKALGIPVSEKTLSVFKK